jgi:hypothetical protein
VTGTADVIQISEHWEVRDGKALSLWVAYFEPQALLDKIKRDLTNGFSGGHSLQVSAAGNQPPKVMAKAFSAGRVEERAC